MRKQSGKTRNRHGVDEEPEHKRFGERLCCLMKAQNISQKELAREAKISERSLRNYLAGRTYPKQSTLTAIAKAMKLTTLELENPQAFLNVMSSSTVDFQKLTFEQIYDLLMEVDSYLLSLIRSITLKDHDAIKRGYSDILTSELLKKGLTIVGFLNFIHNKDSAARLISTLPSKPSLQIRVGKHFERVDFMREGTVILPIHGAQLLWDCCCTSRSEPNPHCAIHSHTMGNAVNEMFENGLVEIKWNDMRFLWRQSRVLWPPSVDSFFFIESLERAGITTSDVRTVLDIGSGTGFLGIALARLKGDMKKVVLSDWLLTPALFGQLNWQLNAPEGSTTSVISQVTMHAETLPPSEALFDLVVCNPPYLPCLTGFDQTGLESTVFWTDLLEYVIQRGKSLGKRVFVQYSHLARPEAMRAAKAAGLQLKVIHTRKNVPFRVRHALARPKYMESLVRERELRQAVGEGHRYLHDLFTCEVI